MVKISVFNQRLIRINYVCNDDFILQIVQVGYCRVHFIQHHYVIVNLAGSMRILHSEFSSALAEFKKVLD